MRALRSIILTLTNRTSRIVLLPAEAADPPTHLLAIQSRLSPYESGWIPVVPERHGHAEWVSIDHVLSIALSPEDDEEQVLSASAYAHAEFPESDEATL